MNIEDILRRIGYDILSITILGHYVVKFSAERVRRTQARIEKNEEITVLDMNDTFTLFVSDVGFNGLGNLYVIFNEVREPNFTFDIYEYENMKDYELFD